MTEPHCNDCGKDTVMKPGRDRVEWWLCVPCYLRSVKDEPIVRGRR